MWTTSNTVRLSLFFAAAVVLMATGYSAYKGHADDSDVNALLAAYPKLKGSAMDSCATCHRSGEVPDTGKPGKMRRENHCDYCHVIHVHQKRDAKETLNRYGAALPRCRPGCQGGARPSRTRIPMVTVFPMKRSF